MSGQSNAIAMPIKIALLGASGRLGQQVVKAIANNQQVELSQALVSVNSKYLGRSIGEITRTNIAITCTCELQDDCDVLIDFSTREASMAYLEQSVQKSLPVVLCTTGFDQRQHQRIAEVAKILPLLKASNTSLGITLLLQLVRQAASKLPNADVEIIEAHHRRKVDSPSGTAISLGEAAASAKGKNLDQAIYKRHGLVGERPEGPIGFATVRGGGIIGDHSIILAMEDETLEISHRALSRSLFANGAIRAALWLTDQVAGRLYTMEDVLERQLN